MPNDGYIAENGIRGEVMCDFGDNNFYRHSVWQARIEEFKNGMEFENGMIKKTGFTKWICTSCYNNFATVGVLQTKWINCSKLIVLMA